LYDANYVPVGKDQLQHVEMTRDVASRVNNKYGEIFVIPEVKLQENTQLIPGTDGEKMSKSRENTIDLFQDPKQIKKIINKNIITDDTPLEAPKDPKSSTVYQLFQLIASSEKSLKMKENLKAGGYGWGHAKKELADELVTSFAPQREKFNYYLSNPSEVESVLIKGAEKAKKVANTTLNRFRKTLGYNI
jgi:tryptophanyl-tRNA synthetase